MKQKIHFIRTAPYDYLLPGQSLYQSFNAVAQREVDPPIITDGVSMNLFTSAKRRLLHNTKVSCSPTLRSRQTASLFSSQGVPDNRLYEVSYKMENFIREEDFFTKGGKPDVTKARQGFVQALITDQLEEKYDHVIGRIESFLQVIEERDEDSIVFSHGFFLKILEAYVRDTNIKTHPERLLQYFNGIKETFHFCEGFTVIKNNKGYIFEEYIDRKVDI